MAESQTADCHGDVEIQIFNGFLHELVNSGISTEIVNKLRKTLLEEHNYSERALRAIIIEE